MAKITINEILASFASTTSINNRFQQIEDELNSKVFYRDNPEGEANSLSNDLDMDGFSILNQANPVILTGGFNWLGDWDSGTTYSEGDAIYYGGTSYVCILESLNNTPPNLTYWQILATASLPAQAGNENKVLATDGTNASWEIRELVVEDKVAAVLIDPIAGQTMYIRSEDGRGNTWRAVIGSSGHSDDGGSYCGTEFIPTGGDGSSAWIRDYNGPINVKWFGAIGDGATNDSAAFQAAIDSARSSTVCSVYVPPVDTYYLVDSLELYGDHVYFDASEAYLRNTSANDMFTLGDTIKLSRSSILINRIYNALGAGHVFVNKGLNSEINFDIKRLVNLATDKSIFISTDTTGGSLFFCTFEGDYWHHSTSSTVPAFNIKGADNVCSENRFIFTRADRCGSTHYFKFECTGSNYFYNNKIETSFEELNGGAVALYGCAHTMIANGGFYDMGTTTEDLILLSKSAAGLGCIGTTLLNINRTMGTLGSGLFDVNVDDATKTTIINCGSHASGVGVAYDLNSQDCVIINPMQITFSNDTDAYYISEENNGNLTTKQAGTLTISGGVITVVNRSLYELETESLGATDNLDTINGGSDGLRLILKSTTSARVPTIRDGAGNIKLDGGVDFSLDSPRDIIELIYDSGLSQWLEISRSNNA